MRSVDRCIAVVAASATLSMSPVVHAVALPAGFTLETVIGAPFADYPIGFAFLPDGRILVIEKESGNVRLAAVGAGTSVVIARLTGLQTDNERGLLGVAVDPGWPVRPSVYFMATYADQRTRIVLCAASGDLTQPGSTAIALASPYVVVDVITNNFPNHKGGTLRFGPDGMLYASTGDDSDDCAAQDIDTTNGKILRLDVFDLPGAGSGPPALATLVPAGNPYPGPSDWARLVFAHGLRNPFRFTIDAQSGDLVIGDVGAHAQEEIDVLEAGGKSGANFGWPFYEGHRVIAGACDSGGPAFVPPVHTYLHDEPVPYAVIAGPRYRRVAASPLSFPIAYDGNIFYHDHYAGWIRRLVDSQGNWFPATPAPGQADPFDWASGLGAIADMQTGADGALYLLVLAGAPGVAPGLHRIVYTPVTDTGDALPAAARAAPNPTRPGLGATLAFAGAHGPHAEIHVYDVGGRRIRTIQTDAGGRLGIWDGRSDDGAVAAPGLYLYERRNRHGVDARGKLLVTR